VTELSMVLEALTKMEGNLNSRLNEFEKRLDKLEGRQDKTDNVTAKLTAIVERLTSDESAIVKRTQNGLAINKDRFYAECRKARIPNRMALAELEKEGLLYRQGTPHRTCVVWVSPEPPENVRAVVLKVF